MIALRYALFAFAVLAFGYMVYLIAGHWEIAVLATVGIGSPLFWWMHCSLEDARVQRQVGRSQPEPGSTSL